MNETSGDNPPQQVPEVVHGKHVEPPAEELTPRETQNEIREATEAVDRRKEGNPVYDDLKLAWQQEMRWLDKQVEEEKITAEQRTEYLASLFAELESKSDHDQLTNLYTRIAFRQYANKAIRTAERKGERLTVAMIDLDHFKRINDVHGHATGDEVLKEVATYLNEHTRGDVIIGRWGGEEFAAVLPHTDQDEAGLVFERLMEGMPKGMHDGSIDVTASIGYAISAPTDTLETLLDAADASLYRAKEDGRDRAVTVKNGNLITIQPPRAKPPSGQL
jgi:diguanylate cyclase (GGDEF)-like protein